MKILFLTQWYPSRQQPFMGVFVREHARALVKVGQEVTVAALTLHFSIHPFKKKLIQYTDEVGIQVTQCELHTIFKDLLYHMPFIQYLFLKKTIKASIATYGKPALLHSQVIYPAGIWGKTISRQLGVPHVITEHWSRLNDFSKTLYSQLGKKAYREAQLIMPVSNFLKESILTFDPELNKNKMVVIANVVDPALFYYPLDNKKSSSNELIFCAVATWQHKKKPDKLPELFIDALANLQVHENRKLKLVMIGGGNKTNLLQKRCKQAGLAATFTGYLPKDSIAEHLRKADYFLHASRIETFSIVVAEALACGLPVVCSNTGALPELIDGTNGFLSENTPESWEDAIRKAIQTPYNKETIAKNSNQKYGFKAIGKKICEAYDSVLVL
jgi:glycosyltransferase involved in cell wall biosynthesis